MIPICCTEEQMTCLVGRMQRWRDSRRIVFTNGVFDLLHIGHLHVLSFAKAQGDA